jgi:hypothetical protein
VSHPKEMKLEHSGGLKALSDAFAASAGAFGIP